ncbi:DUF551 domain-containing protein [Raoultella planticola]|uniref:DUF551 domain-containing protein n=1 Tax=Raoultella planticola TaxID=575 RepID=UPI001F52B72B|nr:DUF551 domain-containing protein [Raoultella planticola]UNK76089.1 DUF551 domain-containing protein [Raoultella planticola]
MTSKLTIEQTQQIIDAADAVITALAGTNDEVHKDDTDKMVRLWDDLNDRYAPPEVVRELARMALAAMGSEPVAYADPQSFDNFKSNGGENAACTKEWMWRDHSAGLIPLYRHAQQPVVPDDVLDALQKVARIRLDLNDFDGDRRGIADCLGDAEEALIEVVNRRAAMLQESQKSAGESNNCRSCENVQDLQAGNSPAQGGSRCSIKAAPALDSSPKTADARCGSSPVIPDCWIPVSERMPEETEPFGGDLFSPDVLTQNQDGDMHVCCTQWGKWIHKKFPGDVITHWQNLPPEAREVKDE